MTSGSLSRRDHVLDGRRDIQIARKVLLTIIENPAADESGSDNPTRRVPSTRELGRLIAERGEAGDA
jgi:hypothetical protein